MSEFICPKCGNPGLPSIYRPTCTACANEERRASGEIKNSNQSAQQGVQRTGSRLIRFVLIFGWLVLLAEVLAIIARR